MHWSAAVLQHISGRVVWTSLPDLCLLLFVLCRQIKEASGEIDFKALGNQQYGWKGVAFKVRQHPCGSWQSCLAAVH